MHLLRLSHLATFKFKAALVGAMLLCVLASMTHANAFFKMQWPLTDFSNTSIDLDEIISGGPPKDGIPAIDNPIFKTADEITDIGPNEPVISLEINGDARSYPVRVLMFHEIANDVVGGVPVAITYCPLCNAALVFERQVGERLLDFGTTGKLRFSDMVMYDRQTESWWQQFTGMGIVGHYNGTELQKRPSRVEAFAQFKERHPKGRVLVPNNPRARPYGTNPYTHYDSKEWPFLYFGEYDGPVAPLERVVAIANEAWPLSLVRDLGTIEHEGMTITWQSGLNSALDHRNIDQGKDIGSVRVEANGQDVVYHLPFAFAFLAFNEAGILHQEGTYAK